MTHINMPIASTTYINMPVVLATGILILLLIIRIIMQSAVITACNKQQYIWIISSKSIGNYGNYENQAQCKSLCCMNRSNKLDQTAEALQSIELSHCSENMSIEQEISQIVKQVLRSSVPHSSQCSKLRICTNSLSHSNCGSTLSFAHCASNISIQVYSVLYFCELRKII